MTDKRFRWGALFAGMADPLNAAKAGVLFFWQVIILVVILAMVWGGYSLFMQFKPAPPTPDVVTAETANIDKSSRTITNNYGPLSSLFRFGSSGKVNSD